jgi:CrcB protein
VPDPQRARRGGSGIARATAADVDVLAVVAAGGVLGAAARFAVAEAIPHRPGAFPWATFWTNLLGSLVLGFLLVLVLERFPPGRYLRPFLATGIVGAFTTMSTFAVETAVLIKDGHVTAGLLYAFATVICGLTLAYAGTVAARLVTGRAPGDGS